jgi:putative transposase
MPQSFSAVYLHLVFSTKNRIPFLNSSEIRAEMHTYLGGISNQIGAPSLLVGGTEDHIHALCRLGRSLPFSELVKELKRVSSIWIKKKAPDLSEFSWQSGYGMFSVSPSNIDAVRAYIGAQEAHHRSLTFQEEFRLILKKHGIEWDERYVWD